MNKESAYRAVKTAIKNGVLLRPSVCQNCGTIPKPTTDGRAAIQAHHADYSRPLDVEWICAKCHRKETPLPKIMGGRAIGEKNGQAKLTEVDVLSAKRLRSKGLPYSSIAKRFNVDKRTIMRAIKGEQWNHIDALLLGKEG